MRVKRKKVIHTVLSRLLGLCVGSLVLVVPLFAQGTEKEEMKEIRV